MAESSKPDVQMPENTVYVGNLNCDVTEEELTSLFKAYNPISLKKILRERKCFAFVKLSSYKATFKAVQTLHKTMFKGRMLILRLCNQEHVRGYLDVTKISATKVKGVYLPDSVAEAIENITDLKINSDNSAGNPECDFENPQDELAAELYKLCRDNVFVQNIKRKISVSELPDCTVEVDTFIVERIKPINVREQHSVLSSAGVQASPSRTTFQEEVQQNGTLYEGQLLNTETSCFGNQEESDTFQTFSDPMPRLEYVPPDTSEDKQACLHEIFHYCTGPKVSTYTIPPEMRSSFLTNMLRYCYNDLSWLTEIMRVSGKVILLVTKIFPHSPYFWAILMSKDTITNLKNMLYRLNVQQDQLIFLRKKDVQKGIWCLAQCSMFSGEESVFYSLYRCWVVKVFPEAATIYLVDCGVTTNVLLQTLCRLDDALFWSIPPLAQPFALKNGYVLSDFHGTIITGEISGSCEKEPHILRFSNAEKTMDTRLP